MWFNKLSFSKIVIKALAKKKKCRRTAEESRTKVILVDFGYPVMLFGLLTPKDWSYLAFQSYNYESVWGRLFQKRILCSKVAIYMYALFAQDNDYLYDRGRSIVVLICYII
jgi:hypothetical protein